MFSPRTTLALACGIFLAAGTLLASVGPTLDRLAANNGQDVAALGGLFTAVSLGCVLAQFVAGPFGERFGQRPVLFGGMLLMGGGMLGVSLSTSLAVLLAAALFAGLGFGSVLAGGNLLIAQLYAERAAPALNLLNLFFGVGSIIGPIVSGLVRAWLDLPQAALWLGAGLILAQAPLLSGYATPQVDLASAPRTSLRAAAAMPPLWILGLLLLVYSGSEIGVGGWATIYLQRSSGLDLASASLATTAFWSALTAGRGLGALIGLGLPPQRLLLICLAGLLGGASLLWLAVGNLWLTVASLCLFGLACGPVFPTAIALTAAIGRGSSAATSLVLAVANLGGMLIPAMLGGLIVGSGPAAGAALLISASLILLTLYAALAFTTRPRLVLPEA